MQKMGKRLRNIILAGIILPAGFLGFSFGKVKLAQNGKTEYVIIQGQSAAIAEEFAAIELSAYLEIVTGVQFPVVNETNLTGKVKGIYIGKTEFASKHGIDILKMDGEEWRIQTVGENLVIIGGRPVGTLYAVYEFLEKNIGCHWLDRDTEIVPARPDLNIAKLKLRTKPDFWNRSITIGLYSIEASSIMFEKEGLFLVRNKSTMWPAKFGQVNYGSPGGCHTFYAYSKDFPTNHPEYFSMDASGKRVRATSGSGPGQLCLMNPETRKLMLDQLKKFITQDREGAAKAGQPAPRVYDISHNDGGESYICLCPTCKAFAEKEGSDSGLMIDFINELADGIKAEYPDIFVMTFAYTCTLKPAKTLKPRDNVIIRLAQLGSEWGPRDPHYPDHFRPMLHPVNRTALEDMAGWSKISRHLAVWDYWIIYLDKYPTPYVNVACLQPDLKTFLDNHVENVYVECEDSETTSFSALKLWLGQKLLQDPNQSAEPLMQIFMNGYYGAAASKMRKYLDYMEKRIAAVPATEKMSSMRELRPYLDLEFFTTADRLLTEAEQACGADQKALLHVRHEWVPFCAALYNMWSHLEQKLPHGQKLSFDRETILQKYVTNRYAQLEACYYGKIPQKIKDGVEKELKTYRELPDLEKRKAEAPPQLKAPALLKTAENPPDGDPLKVDWSKAGVADKWYTLLGYATERKVSVRVIHDGKFLYIQMEEACDPSKLSIGKDATWEGDDWELFFTAQRGNPPYHQFCVGPSGQTHAIKYPKKWGEAPAIAWDSGAKVKSERSDGKWTVNVVLPLDKLLPDGVKPGEKIYANFGRGTPKPADHLAWSPTFVDDFHILARFGELTLE